MKSGLEQRILLVGRREPPASATLTKCYPDFRSGRNAEAFTGQQQYRWQRHVHCRRCSPFPDGERPVTASTDLVMISDQAASD